MIKTTKEITIQEKRKMELIIKSGVTESNKPFRAPVYSSYREAFRGLSNQGFLGFFKGNLFNTFHIIVNQSTKFVLLGGLEYSNAYFVHD